MVRKLKTFVTSLGFFEEAVAVPSMKAAIEVLGGGKDLFEKGFAKETDDPAIISAAMEHPGVVIKRSVGSKGTFQLHAKPPKELPQGTFNKAPKEKPSKARVTSKSTSKRSANARKAAEQYALQKERREEQRRKEEITRAEAVERREANTAKAKEAFEGAEKKHEQLMSQLEAQRDAINDKIETEESAWATGRKRLESAIKKARKS